MVCLRLPVIMEAREITCLESTIKTPVHTISKSAIVSYTPHEMYSLVDDITSYGDFLPWCKAASELRRDEEEVEASIHIAKGGLNQAFTTCNSLLKPHKIEMRLVEGPFKQLHGRWHFDALGDSACKISLTLQFEFSNSLHALMFGPIFHSLANKMIDAFHQRAFYVYGKR